MNAKMLMGGSCGVLAACLAVAPAPAFAADAAAGTAAGSASQIEEVVVTARKREESDLSVPVSVTALSARQIERLAVLNMSDIALRDPTLSVESNTSTAGGGMFLRGIGTTADISGTLEQSVSLDIDGAPISRGNALRVGQYDLDQIQVLKGPQALFFGKDSPAGVIAFRSKDPTSSFETSAKLSYEPYANDRFVELTASGPLTDTLRARIFYHGENTDGDKDNLSALALPANAILPNSVFAHPHKHAWTSRESFVRGTLVFEPNDRFKARLTSSYDFLQGDGTATVPEIGYCPQGRPQTSTLAFLLGAGAQIGALANALAVDDCKLNGTVTAGGINPAFTIAPQSFGHDVGGVNQSQISISVAELKYQVTPSIDLTSVSSFTWIRSRDMDGFSWAPAAAAVLTYYNYALQNQFTQEVRATTKFSTPLNFMVGGFFESAFFDTFADNTAIPPFTNFKYHVPNRVYSGFAQALWDITPQIELAAGARYTRETKELALTRDGVRQPTANPKATFENTSPEVSLTWRPTQRATAYVAYKTGFKSGGYAETIVGNAPPLPTNPLLDMLYNPEKAKGFEGGVKAELFDRTLRIDTTIYRYKYSNLQESNYDTSTGAPILRVLNAATALQRGVEISAVYSPPFAEGLRVNGMVNYNKSTCQRFISPCYVGQSIAQGCNLLPGPGGAFTSQDLSGRTFPNAPRWVGAAGFSYSHPLGNARLEFGADTAYHSAYNASSDLSPGGHQKAYALLSGQIRLISESGGWEIGVYGKNLTDVRRSLDSLPVPATGNSAATGTINGGLLARADLAAFTNPGRAVFIQLVLRPGALLARRH